MSGDEKYELTLSFDELTLIYKSLLAAKSLGVLSQDHGFVGDTIPDRRTGTQRSEC